MTDEVQLDAFVTPGTLLRAAREAQQLSEREVADRLNWMPDYTAIIERDDYQALRRPAFARGYVKAYGKMLGLDELQLLDAFDRLGEDAAAEKTRRSVNRPLQLQRTGLGVVIGLVLLVLLVAVVWWWRAEPRQAEPLPAEPRQAEPRQADQNPAVGMAQPATRPDARAITQPDYALTGER